jgi:hypothetical protein
VKNIIKPISIITLIVLASGLFSCSDIKNESAELSGISLKGQKLNDRTDELIRLKLIDKKDTVLGLFYSFSNEPGFNSQRYLILTNHKLVQYYNIDQELKGPEIINIPLNKILNTRQEIDPVDSTRILIKINKLDTILYLKHEKRDKIFVDKFDFRPPHKSSLSDQKEFYRLLVLSWRETVNYNSLTETYNVFFDESGSIKTTSDEMFSRGKLQSLKNELTEYSINVIDKKNYLAIVHNSSIFKITYNSYLKKFSILKLTVEPIPENESDMIVVLATYPSHKHKSIIFPYSERGVTYKEGYFSKETTGKDIIEKYFKQ